MPTKEEIEVFNQMQECIQINEVEQVSPSGIIFEYNGITYCIKCESSQRVKVRGAVPPNAFSATFTKEREKDEYWNFNLADVDKDNYKGTESCSFPLVPENADKLKEFLDKLAENSKTENILKH